MNKLSGRELAYAIRSRLTFVTFEADKRWFLQAAEEIENLCEKVDNLSKK